METLESYSLEMPLVSLGRIKAFPPIFLSKSFLQAWSKHYLGFSLRISHLCFLTNIPGFLLHANPVLVTGNTAVNKRDNPCSMQLLFQWGEIDEEQNK